jgi:hypothetical protein
MTLIESIKGWIYFLLAVPTILWLVIYGGILQDLLITYLPNSLVCLCDIVTNLYMLHFGPVDLKKKYNAKWALVTGAGTGIGKSIAETMALQGLNVVLVSLPDKVYFSLHNSFFKINN